MRRIEIKEWKELVVKVILKIRNQNYTGVFGVPRGGTPISLVVSDTLKIPLLDKPIEGCVVVDDLIDSGRTMSKYKDYEFIALIDKRLPEWEGQWIEFWYENTQKDAEDIVTRQIEFMGDNPKRKGVVDTPRRVVKMWKELFRGYDPKQKPTITIFENGEDGITYDNMVVDTGDFYSYCEHHMVPFFGQYWFAYIPDKKIMGISKVARIVDYYSAKLQIQERLVKEILDAIEKEVDPKGLALVMKGEHLCKTMRGVKKKGEMITSDLRGSFKNEHDCRAEFMRFVK